MMIPTALSSISDVSISPDGGRLYAAGLTSELESVPAVEVIDIKAIDVIASILLPSAETPPAGGIYTDLPLKIAITPDGNHAYVTGVLGSI